MALQSATFWNHPLNDMCQLFDWHYVCESGDKPCQRIKKKKHHLQ